MNNQMKLISEKMIDNAKAAEYSAKKALEALRQVETYSSNESHNTWDAYQKVA